LFPLQAEFKLNKMYRDAVSRRNLGTTFGTRATERFQGWYMQGSLPDSSDKAVSDHEKSARPKPFRGS
jgi:hypothetical protein